MLANRCRWNKWLLLMTYSLRTDELISRDEMILPYFLQSNEIPVIMRVRGSANDRQTIDDVRATTRIVLAKWSKIRSRRWRTCCNPTKFQCSYEFAVSMNWFDVQTAMGMEDWLAQPTAIHHHDVHTVIEWEIQWSNVEHAFQRKSDSWESYYLSDRMNLCWVIQ